MLELLTRISELPTLHEPSLHEPWPWPIEMSKHNIYDVPWSVPFFTRTCFICATSTWHTSKATRQKQCKKIILDKYRLVQCPHQMLLRKYYDFPNMNKTSSRHCMAKCWVLKRCFLLTKSEALTLNHQLPVQHRQLPSQLKFTIEKHQKLHIQHRRDVSCRGYQGEHLGVLDSQTSHRTEVLGEHEGHQEVCWKTSSLDKQSLVIFSLEDHVISDAYTSDLCLTILLPLPNPWWPPSSEYRLPLLWLNQSRME